MAQRRHHYERAFEGFLRARRIPYVAVDEARKALTPGNGSIDPGKLKSFDFVLYGVEALGGVGFGTGNLLVDIKGRKIGGGKAAKDGSLRVGRMESWVTMEDVESLLAWEKLFGEGFSSAFVFVYACEAQPPDALFQEVFEDHGVWYALRAVTVAAYRSAMRVRSPRWGTVDVARRVFERISSPLGAGAGCEALLGG